MVTQFAGIRGRPRSTSVAATGLSRHDPARRGGPCATYNASTGVLAVTATGIVGTNVNLGKFTLTGESGAT